MCENYHNKLWSVFLAALATELYI